MSKFKFSLFAFVALIIATSLPVSAADRPNIIWITAEDMSAVLGCYGDEYATTPNIDALAKRSVKYTHAFATAPVCSPSRTCLINGVHAQTQGTHNMRSAFPIPKHMTGFPSFLRKVGYYTSNNVKTDYNSANWETIINQSWDESSDTAHWRNRKDKSKPFFSVFNLMTSHQSRAMVWPYEKFKEEVQNNLSTNEIHDPAKAPLPPYYPDSPIIRKTVARFYDCVTAMDKQVGAILQQLKDDGLDENTIVFFYSDHGSGMPRHKRALLDSGMHVPMLVRFPRKWQHLAPGDPGSTTDRLVSFIDFGPTVLSLAGVDVPDYMQGQPFMGKQEAKPRDYVIGHRDRVDEVMDMARSIRDKRYLYIRNYMPQLGYNQPTAWPDLGEIRPEIYRLTDQKKMTGPQWHFAGPTRAIEELYDCQADPKNLNNIAGKPEGAKVITRMRQDLEKQMLAVRDLGFIPEAQMWERIGDHKTPMDIGAAMKDGELASLINAAAEASKSQPLNALKQNMASNDAAVRYWACVGLSKNKPLGDEQLKLLQIALKDSSVTVRIEAANALARQGKFVRSLPVLAKALESKNLSVVQHAARTIELLGDKAKSIVPAMKEADARLKGLRPKDIPATVVLPGDLDMAMFIGFSIQAFLKNVDTDANANSDASEWIDLFDGKSLAGWKPQSKSDKIDIKVVDGEIQINSKGTNLWYSHEKVLKDFEIEAEAFMPEGAYNSGLAFRCQTGGKKFTGYQCEIDRAKSGMIYAIGKGWVWPKGKDQAAQFAKMAGDSFKDGKWNQFKVRCEGKHIQIWVNGVKTADVQDDLFSEGVIAIQHHGKGDVHRFRKIRVRAIQ